MASGDDGVPDMKRVKMNDEQNPTLSRIPQKLGQDFSGLPPKLMADHRSIQTEVPTLVNGYRLNIRANCTVFKHQFDISFVTRAGKEKLLSEGVKNDIARKSRRRASWLIYEAVLKKFPDFFGKNQREMIFDTGRALYTKARLTEPGAKTEFDIETAEVGNLEFELLGRIDKFHITVEFVEEIPLASRNYNEQTVQFLEVLTWQYAVRKNEMLMFPGKAFFPNRQLNLDNDPRILYRGLSKNVRVIGDVGSKDHFFMVQLDTKISPFFPEMPVIRFLEMLMCTGRDRDFSRMFADDRNGSRRESARKTLKNMVVRTTHLAKNKIFVVHTLGHRLDEVFFEKEGNKIAVKSYMEERYKMRLNRDLPVVVHKKGSELNFYPMEVLEILPGQRIPMEKQQMENSLTEKMTRQCQQLPDAIKKEYVEIKTALFLNNGNPFLKAFDIDVDNDLNNTKAGVLRPPEINYGKNRTEKLFRDVNWRLNGVSFVDPRGRDLRWCILNVGRAVSDQDLNNFERALGHRSNELGMNLPPTQRAPRLLNTSDDGCRSFMDDCKRENITFIMFVTSEKMDPIHDVFKALEVDTKIITQHVWRGTVRKATSDRGANMVLENLLQKTNLKIGGVNHEVAAAAQLMGLRTGVRSNREWLTEGRMFFGIDVSHGGPQSLVERQGGQEFTTPSVVGMAYNVDKQLRLSGTYFFQPARSAIINNLKEHFEKAIEKYKSSNKGNVPSEIIVYRDGVSEGEFRYVLTVEVPQMKEAIARFSRDAQLIVVVVQRTSNYRLLKTDIRSGEKAPQMNVTPGTFIDRNSTHPLLSEFVMVAHRTIQGTGRPIRYSVIYDGFKNRMPLETLANITNMMCYTHGIVASPVCVPGPLYSATELSKRGSKNMKFRDMPHGEDALQVLSQQLEPQIPTRFWA